MSEVRLTRGEYWLLEAAVEMWLPLHLLVNTNLTTVLNKRAGHGLDRPGLASTLRALHEHGWILLEDQDGVATSPDEIDHGLDVTERPIRGFDTKGAICYGLTAAGGAVWEEFAAPDWSRFVDESEGVDDDVESSEIVIVGADERRVERARESVERTRFVVDGTLARRELVPWQATYWKTLPRGFEVRCRVGREKQDFEPPREHEWYAWGG